MDEYGISPGKLFFVGLLSVVLTIDAVIGLQALYYWQLRQAETSESLYRPSEKYVKAREAQRVRLAEYRLENAEKGVVAVPIERAMQLVVDEFAKPNDEKGGRK